MADALGTIESCYTYGKILYEFIDKVKNAPKEQRSFFSEVQSMLKPIEHLWEEIKEIKPGDPVPGYLSEIIGLKHTDSSSQSTTSTPRRYHFPRLHLHRNHHAPKNEAGHMEGSSRFEAKGLLLELQGTLKDLKDELVPDEGVKKSWKAFKWYFTNEGVEKKVQTASRQLDLIDRAIQIDRDARSKRIETNQEEADWQKQRKNLIKWLSPLEPHLRQQAIAKDTFPDAYHWLLTSSEYQTWVQGRPWYLWCSGESGTGKSVLAAQITQHLKDTEEDALVLDLFIDDNDSDTKKLDNLIGSLAKQIVQDEFQRTLSKKADKLKTMLQQDYYNTRPKPDDLIEALKERFTRYTRVFLIIDAWEKLPSSVSDELETKIKKLSECSGHGNKLSIMVTATLSEEDTRKRDIYCNHCKALDLKGYYFCNVCVKDFCDMCTQKGYKCSVQEHVMRPVDRAHVRVLPSEPEIRRYLDWEIGEATSNESDRSTNYREGSTSLTETELGQNLRTDPNLRERIPLVLSKKSPHSYQIAKVYIELIKLMPSVLKIYETLNEDIPSELGGIYANLLNAINRIEPRVSAKMVMEALYWIAFAEKPLSFPALSHVLGISPGAFEHPYGADVHKSALLRNSSGLIYISFDEKFVRVDTTVNEWLRQSENKAKWFMGKDRDAASKILTYLKYNGFKSPCPNDDESAIAGRLKDFPFLEYACQYWDEHVTQVSSDVEIQDQVVDFLSHPGSVASYLQIIYHRGSQTFDLDVRRGLNGLHLAAFFGLEPIVVKLIDMGMDVNSKDTAYEQTPLMYSCRRGHLRTVQALLDRKASVNLWSKRGRNALFEAYCGDQGDIDSRMRITKILLGQKGIPVNGRNEEKQRRTLLILAANRGDKSTVELLLQHPGIDVNCQDIHGDTALAVATFRGNQPVVELLLQDKRVNIHISNNGGNEPLNLTTDRNLLDIFLSKFASTITKEHSAIKVALARIVEKGDVSLVHTFLRHNVSVHGFDKDGKTLLHTAAAGGQAEMMKFLIDQKINVNTQDHCGRTPLHECARAGNKDGITSLLDASADPSIKDKSGRAPIIVARQNATSMRHLRCIALLDDSSLDIAKKEQIVSRAKELPSWSLVSLGDHPDFSSELDRRIGEGDKGDLMDQDPDTGNTALHIAASKARMKILEKLLVTSTKQDCQNHAGETPLHLAVSCNHKNSLDAVKLLLKHAPSPLTLRDQSGFTPLQIALRRSRFDVAVALLEAGDDVKEVTNTSLHSTFIQAVELRNIKVAEILLKHGADQLRPGSEGYTARQIARAYEDAEMLKMLNENENLFVPVRPSGVIDGDDGNDKGSDGFFSAVPQLTIYLGGILLAILSYFILKTLE